MFTQHLIGLAASRNCAASVISNLSLTLCPLLKLSSLLALGVKVIYSWPWSIQFCTKTTLQKKSTFHLEVNRLSNLRYVYEFLQVLSSPELKAQVSFSDRPSSVVRLFDRLSVNFSYFHLLLQSHKGNFNQTWHKASLKKRKKKIQVCSNEGPHLFPRGDNNEIANVLWWNTKEIFLSRTTLPI